MTDTAKQIREVKKKIAKLKNDFKRGVSPFFGFTIDISYGGNKHIDIERVCVGSVYNEENDSKKFYDFVLNSLENSLVFWEKTAKREIEELYDALKE